MSQRAIELQATADGQVARLQALVAGADADALGRPCRGRAKLGDGSVAAVVMHTAENYARIATFVSAPWDAAGGHAPSAQAGGPGHKVPWILRVLGHRPPAGPHAPGARDYGADAFDRADVLDTLERARTEMAVIVDLDDADLDRVPAAASFRFADRKRTLEAVLGGLLAHQAHQLSVLAGALG